LERFSFVFLVAGIFFFVLAFLVSGYIPMIQVQHLEVRTVEQLAAIQPLEFLELQEQYPEAYAKAFPGQDDATAFAEALRVGHKTYIGEACWHCHSQQIRPWGNDEARYGRKSYPEEYHNELNMPPLWGTRRIGPDLIRRGGKQSNDWHVAHFYHPPDVNPVSVMPSYPWFFEDDARTPNKLGLSIIAYVQWLGSWEPTIRETVYSIPSIEASYPPSDVTGPVKPEEESAGEEDVWGATESEDDFWAEEP
jgi:cbb3-type cytochrome oxidase cytochrome c subunit